MARSTVLLKRCVIHIHILQSTKKLDYRVVIANTCYCLASHIFEGKWFDDTSSLKSASNSDMFWMHLFLNSWIFWTWNATILSSSIKDNFVRTSCQTFIILKILFNNENTLFFRIAKFFIFNNLKLSVISLSFFFSLATLYRTNGIKFKPCEFWNILY